MYTNFARYTRRHCEAQSRTQTLVKVGGQSERVALLPFRHIESQACDKISHIITPLEMTLALNKTFVFKATN